MKGLKISNETKVGALTAITITLLVLGYNFMKGKPLFTSTKTYYVMYDRVEGLTSNNPVTVNGYRVGQVSNVELQQGEKISFKVELEMGSDVVIKEGSIARIINADFFNSKAIELELSPTGEVVKNNGTLAGEIEPALISSISSIAAPLKEKVESILISLDSVFGGESGENLRRTINHVEHITRNFKNTSTNLDKMIAEQKVRLDEILGNVVSISQNLKNNGPKLNSIINNLNRFSDTIATLDIRKVVTDAQSVMAQVEAITDKINKGEGSIGLLLNDKELYENLTKSSSSLDSLLKDMKEHPKRYVHFSIFGRKEKKDKK